MTGESILTLDRVLALAKQVVDGKSISYVGAAKQMSEWLLTNEAKLHGVHGRIVVPDGVAVRFTPHPFPKIVCLCGSTRFGDAFAKANLDETLKGNIVLTVGCMTHSDEQLGKLIDVRRCRRCHMREDDQRGVLLVGGKPACGTNVVKPGGIKERMPDHDFVDTKVLLDELHKRKIDLCDEVLVLNVMQCIHCGWPISDGGCFKSHKLVPYIGDSTRSEIEYAVRLGKPVRYLNEVKP